MKHTFSINQYYANINFDNRGDSREGHYPILHRVLNFMASRGFTVGRDLRIQKHYNILNKDHWYGRKGDLEFKASRYPAGFKLEFFQNIVFENKSGGEYDFDKYQKMPYVIKLMFRNEVKHIKAFLEQLGCVDNSKPVHKLAYDKIVQAYIDSWHTPQKEAFLLEELHGSEARDSYQNGIDRDNKTILNGQLKYFRDRWNGHLYRGRVYHNINNMWWVILNDTEVTNISSYELFDPTPDDFMVRRLKTDRKPESYLTRKAKLAEASPRELINELKRRGHEQCLKRVV